MAAGLGPDGSGQVLIEIGIDGPWYMTSEIGTLPGIRIAKVEAAIDGYPVRFTKLRLQFIGTYEDPFSCHFNVSLHSYPQGLVHFLPVLDNSKPLRAVARLFVSIQESRVDKIIVGLKRVVDYNVRVQVKSDGSGVETDGVKMSINPFDEVALEEALRIRERGDASEVIVVSVGTSESQQQLRTGLAMGADRAILVIAEGETDPLSVARIFKALAEKEGADLVMLGKQAIDGDNNQIPQMLGAVWNRPQATYASEVSIDGNTARVVREVDAGLETIEVELPAVISTDLRLNEPRYVKLPDIMKAKKKPLDEISIGDLGIEAGKAIRELHYAPPEGRQRGITVDDVAGLVAELKDRGLV
jgi:electron transfer flavoprotein beta subunit